MSLITKDVGLSNIIHKNNVDWDKQPMTDQRSLTREIGDGSCIIQQEEDILGHYYPQASWPINLVKAHICRKLCNILRILVSVFTQI